MIIKRSGQMDYQDFGLIGEPYFDVDFNEVAYYTDTGRRWDGEDVSVRDKVVKVGSRKEEVGSKKEQNKIKSKKYKIEKVGWMKKEVGREQNISNQASRQPSSRAIEHRSSFFRVTEPSS